RKREYYKSLSIQGFDRVNPYQRFSPDLGDYY
ncbi:MAG: hypothetical protein ACI9BO_000993, partial [Zhongshania sp.]